MTHFPHYSLLGLHFHTHPIFTHFFVFIFTLTQWPTSPLLTSWPRRISAELVPWWGRGSARLVRPPAPARAGPWCGAAAATGTRPSYRSQSWRCLRHAVVLVVYCVGGVSGVLCWWCVVLVVCCVGGVLCWWCIVLVVLVVYCVGGVSGVLCWWCVVLCWWC